MVWSLTKRDKEMDVLRVISIKIHDRIVIQMVVYMHTSSVII